MVLLASLLLYVTLLCSVVRWPLGPFLLNLPFYLHLLVLSPLFACCLLSFKLELNTLSWLSHAAVLLEHLLLAKWVSHLDQFYIQCEWHNELVYVGNSSWNCCSLETLIGLANVILTCLQQHVIFHLIMTCAQESAITMSSSMLMSCESKSCLPKTTGKKWSLRQIFAAELWLQTPLYRCCVHQVTCQLWSLPNSVDVQQL